MKIKKAIFKITNKKNLSIRLLIRFDKIINQINKQVINQIINEIISKTTNEIIDKLIKKILDKIINKITK